MDCRAIHCRATGNRTGQSNGRGVGWDRAMVRHWSEDHGEGPYLHRRRFTHRRHRHLSRRKGGERHRRVKASRGLLSKPRRHCDPRDAPFSADCFAIACQATDNGSCCKAKTFAAACKDLHLKHIRTKPYTPKTNGKAERFIQTALREWAYARACRTSEQRKTHQPEWTHMYNWHRPNGSLNSRPPITRLGQPMDNLLKFHN